jgi:hypothetical protein
MGKRTETEDVAVAAGVIGSAGTIEKNQGGLGPVQTSNGAQEQPKGRWDQSDPGRASLDRRHNGAPSRRSRYFHPNPLWSSFRAIGEAIA